MDLCFDEERIDVLVANGGSPSHSHRQMEIMDVNMTDYSRSMRRRLFHGVKGLPLDMLRRAMARQEFCGDYLNQIAKFSQAKIPHRLFNMGLSRLDFWVKYYPQKFAFDETQRMGRISVYTYSGLRKRVYRNETLMAQEWTQAERTLGRFYRTSNIYVSCPRRRENRQEV